MLPSTETIAETSPFLRPAPVSTRKAPVLKIHREAKKREKHVALNPGRISSEFLRALEPKLTTSDRYCVAGGGRDAFHLQDQNLRQDREDKTKESPSESFHMT